MLRAAVLAAFAVLAHALTIRDITPRIGSVGGGTEVRIDGSGFARQGLEGTTRVFFGSAPCDIVWYYTTDSQIVCVTRAVENDVSNVPIVVQATTVSGASFATCQTTCAFSFSTSWAPILHTHALGAAAGDPLFIYAAPREEDADKFEVTLSSASARLACDAGAEANPAFSPTHWWAYSSLHCTTPAGEAGPHALTLAVRDGFRARGRHAASNDLHFSTRSAVSRVDLRSRQLSVLLVPAVTAVSAVTSGLEGGETIRIRGTGFSPAPAANSVSVAGVDCVVTAATETELRCVVGRPARASDAVPGANVTAETPLFPAGTGVRLDTIEDHSWGLDRALTEPVTLVQSWLGGLQGARRDNGSRYAQVFTGLFVAPRTANYTFWTYGDDANDVSLSTDATVGGLRRVAYSANYLSNRFLSRTQRGRVSLTAGQHYVLRSRHEEGQGGDFVYQGVTIHGAATTSAQREQQSEFETVRVMTQWGGEYERQRIVVGGVGGGTFRVSMPGVGTSDAVAWDASASAVAAAVRAATKCSSISVDRTAYGEGGVTGWAWDVTVRCLGTWQPMTLVASGLTSDPAAGARTTTATRVGAQDTPLSGSFRLRVNGTWTTAIDAGAGARDMEAAITAALAAGGHVASPKVDVWHAGGDSRTGRFWYVVFLRPFGDIPDLETDNSTLRGAGAHVVAETQVEGDASSLHYPIVPPEFLRVASPAPALRVTSNGVEAACRVPGATAFDAANRDGRFGLPRNASSWAEVGCAFSFRADLTPTLTAVSPAAPAPNATLTLTGTGFVAAGTLRHDGTRVALSDYDVRVGGLSCPVTAVVGTTELRCTAPHLPAGPANVSLIVPAGRGAARWAGPAGSAATLSAALSLSAATPATPAAPAGGLLLTVTGLGLPPAGAPADAAAVRVGSAPCRVTATRSTALDCVVPARAAAGADTVDVAVTVGGHTATLTGAVSYLGADDAPVVESVTPGDFSAATATVVTLSGRRLNATTAAAAVVSIAGRPCAVLSTAASTIVCQLPAASATDLAAAVAPAANSSLAPRPQVHFPGLGNATTLAAATAAPGFLLAAAAPSALSVVGAGLVNLTGAGFTARPDVAWTASDPAAGAAPVSVALVPAGGGPAVQCAPTRVAFRALTCVLAARSALSTALAAAEVRSAVWRVTVGALQAPCSAPGACNGSLTADATPALTAVSPTNVTAGETLTLTGTGFSASTPVVFVGDAIAPIGAVTSDTSMTVTAPPATAGVHAVRVVVPPFGAAATAAAVTVHYAAALHAVDKAAVSLAGGRRLRLSGTGFPDVPAHAAVTVGGRAAEVLSAGANHSELVIRVPSGLAPSPGPDTNVTVSVSVAPPPPPTALPTLVSRRLTGAPDPARTAAAAAALATPAAGWAAVPDACGGPGACAVRLTAAATPLLLAVSPAEASAGDRLTLSGASFGACAPAGGRVVVGGVDCAVADWHDNNVTCVLGPTPAGEHAVALLEPVRGLALHARQAAPSPAPGAAVRTTHTVTVRGAIDALPADGAVASVAGGRRVVLTGSGFPGAVRGADGARRVRVRLCGAECAVVSTSATRIECLTPAAPTPASLAAAAAAGASPSPAVLRPAPWPRLEEWPLGAGAGGAYGGRTMHGHAALDGDVGTYHATSNADRCAQIDMGPDALGVLTRVRLHPLFRYVDRVASGRVQVSNDDATWHDVARFDPTVREGWLFIDVAPDGNSTRTSGAGQAVHTGPSLALLRGGARYFRFVPRPGTPCTVTEIEFIGHVVPMGPTGVGQCNATVDLSTRTTAGLAAGGGNGAYNLAFTAGTAAESYMLTLTSTAVTFDVRSTPVVTDISPTNGTALGGTVVTITGRGFGSGSVNVSIDGVPCATQSTSDTSVVCQTGPREAIRTTGLVVSVPGKGRATIERPERVHFRYLDKWSDRNTWTGKILPTTGDTVVIPPGQTVLLDVNTPVLLLLLIQGSLVFDRRDVSLDAHYILVHGGELEVGTPTNPFLHKATITLHGDRRKTIELPHLGAKFLAVMPRVENSSSTSAVDALHARGHGTEGTKTVVSGRLDLHGAPLRRAWTKLAETARAGSTEIKLAEPVDWTVGARIVVTSSSGSFRDAEERTILARPSSTSITLAAPLRVTHVSTVETVQGRTVDMRVEVGILSRNVVIQGDESSTAQMFGVHTLAAMGGTYRLRNVEVRRCGQAGVLGRYCTHTHLVGYHGESYVESNSIHHSFQRGTTVHGARYFRVAHNFYYDVHGHTVFVEDGAEMWNTFEENCVATTRQSFMLLKSDLKPASYWTSSPTNYWFNNVAAGCSHDGYWFEPPNHPGGPSFTTAICPINAPLGDFRNNTAHSNGVHGLRIYPRWTPHTDPCNTNSDPQPQYLRGFVSFRNGGHGIFTKIGGDIHHINATLIENSDDQFFWKKMPEENSRYRWNPFVKDAIIAASLTPRDGVSVAAIMAPQNENFFVDGVDVVNFGASGALRGCASCGTDIDRRQGGYTFRWKSIRFHNSPARVQWTIPFKQIFWDVDGSLSGTPNSTITPYQPWLAVPECSRSDQTLANGTVCGPAVRVRRIILDSHEPRELDHKALSISSTAGTGDQAYDKKEFSGWVFTAVSGYPLTLAFPSTSPDWTKVRLRYSDPFLLEDGLGRQENVVFTFPYSLYRYHYTVKYDGTGAVVPRVPFSRVGIKDSVVPWTRKPTPADPIGTGSIRQDNRTYYVVLSNVNVSDAAPGGDAYGKHRIEVTSAVCPPEGCPQPPPPSVGNRTLWSEAASWASGSPPKLGESVTIPANKWVVVDVNPPRLGVVRVEGKLTFAERNVVFEAESIVVTGDMEVGTPAAPFQSSAVIRLVGETTSPSVFLSNDHDAMNKVLLVAGSLTAQGVSRAVTWTRASASVPSGATQITVTDTVDWAAGEQIVITPTEYSAAPETAVIASRSGRVLTLRSPLVGNYTSATVPVSGGGTRVLSAAIGLLSRNVVFSSEAASSDSGYRGHVTAIAYASGGRVFQGRIRVENVQFDQLGQRSRSMGAINLRYAPRRGNANTQFSPFISSVLPAHIVGCSISFASGYGVIGFGATSTVVKSSVVHSAWTTAIEMDASSANVTVVGNLVAGVQRLPKRAGSWSVPSAGVFLNHPQPFSVRGNVITGCRDVGLAYRGDACSTPFSARRFGANEMVANRIGVMLLSGARSCRTIAHITAWQHAHAGIMSVSQTTTVEVHDVLVSDNHIGVAVDFAHGVRGRTLWINGSTVLGTTLASPGCHASLRCRAMSEDDTQGDGPGCTSVYGNDFRRVGIKLPQLTNRGKTCETDELPLCRPPWDIERMCSMPWGRRYGLPSTPRSSVEITHSMLGHFNATDCGLRSAAIATNPTQSDYIPPTTLRGLHWVSTDANSRIRFHEIAKSKTSIGAGTSDGQLFAFVEDQDGSTWSEASSTAVSNNPALVEAGTCAWNADWLGYRCGPRLPLRGMVLENVASDRGSRLLGPIKVTRVVPANRTVFSMGPVDDPCAMRFFFGSYPFAVSPGYWHELVATATLPKAFRIHFNSDAPSEKVGLRIFLQQPLKLEVFFNQRRVEQLTRLPTLADPSGSHAQDPQGRFLHVVVGGLPGAYLDLRVTPVVQLSMKLAVSVEEFFGDTLVNNLATLLGIAPSRIRIVSVQAGSVAVKVEIIDEPAAPVATETQAVERATRLTQLAETIETKARTGRLDVGYAVQELAIEAPRPPPNDTSLAPNVTSTAPGATPFVPAPLVPPDRNSSAAGGGSPVKPTASTDSFPIALVVGGSAAALLCAILAGVGCWYTRKDRAKAAVVATTDDGIGMTKSNRGHHSNPMQSRKGVYRVPDKTPSAGDVAAEFAGRGAVPLFNGQPGGHAEGSVNGDQDRGSDRSELSSKPYTQSTGTPRTLGSGLNPGPGQPEKARHGSKRSDRELPPLKVPGGRPRWKQ